MTNIISQILEIDAAAQKRLDDANRLKESCEQETVDKLNEASRAAEAQIAQQLDTLRQQEDEKVLREKAVIAARREAAEARLESVYEKCHTQLEETIFRNVTGASADSASH